MKRFGAEASAADSPGSATAGSPIDGCPRPHRASPSQHALHCQNPRQEPGAVVPHAGICPGGRPQGRSLPGLVTTAGTTQPGQSEGPLLHRCAGRKGGILMSAERSARSVSHTEGVDQVRALQRVLYRSAKQDPTRRFPALSDQVARSDIMWRAWFDVVTNRGAPGIDGVTIDAVEAAGVGEFVDGLAAAVKAGTYRPQPLRRVHIPK